MTIVFWISLWFAVGLICFQVGRLYELDPDLFKGIWYRIVGEPEPEDAEGVCRGYCRVPACLNRQDSGSRYCEEHQTEESRPSPWGGISTYVDDSLDSMRWRLIQAGADEHTIRAMYRAMMPMCHPSRNPMTAAPEFIEPTALWPPVCNICGKEWCTPLNHTEAPPVPDIQEDPATGWHVVRERNMLWPEPKEERAVKCAVHECLADAVTDGYCTYHRMNLKRQEAVPAPDWPRAND